MDIGLDNGLVLDKVVLITGANSGIGLEAAKQLAAMGAHIVMVCRDPHKAERARNEILASSRSKTVDLLIADLSFQAEIRTLAARLLAHYPRLDVFVNNAGAVFARRRRSADGFELTMATNYLGPLLLTELLSPLLAKSAPARIINVSSSTQQRAKLDLNDLQGDRRKYSVMGAYGRSKLMLTMATFHLAKQLQGRGITVNCVHPGAVATGIGDVDKGLFLKLAWKLLKPFLMTPADGAKAIVYLAASPEVQDVTGRYFDKCRIAEPNPLAGDAALAAELMQRSRSMLALH